MGPLDISVQQTPLWEGLFHTGGIDMPRFVPTGTHGVRHTQWQGKVMHIRNCHSICTRGVPSTLVMDGVREQVMGEFSHNVRQADCHVMQTEPYSPWQNTAESTNRELKKGAGRKMIKSTSPKKLWDDCLQIEMEIRSCTANNVFELKGEVPRTVMKGETANITHLCEFGWYDWVYFRDNAVG